MLNYSILSDNYVKPLSSLLLSHSTDKETKTLGQKWYTIYYRPVISEIQILQKQNYFM